MAEFSVWGGVVVVDDVDLPLVAGRKWRIERDGYARSRLSERGGAPARHVALHRLILDAPAGVPVDHINHNRVDNRRCNLRLSSARGNSANRAKYAHGSSSRFKGVSWSRQSGKWQAGISAGRRYIYLGRYVNEVEAAQAYDVAAVVYHGEFASLNFAGGVR